MHLALSLDHLSDSLVSAHSSSACYFLAYGYIPWVYIKKSILLSLNTFQMFEMALLVFLLNIFNKPLLNETFPRRDLFVCPHVVANGTIPPFNILRIH